MPTSGNGQFSFTIPSQDLAKGLRPSKRSPRNVKYLTICRGAVGYDNVLQVLEDLNSGVVDTSVITDSFPYPQIFVFNNLTIVCSGTDIYELVAGVLVHQLNVDEEITWSAVDFFDYVYMSNGKVAVVRDAASKEWSVTTDLPIAGAMCNYNGQVFLGAPEVER